MLKKVFNSLSNDFEISVIERAYKNNLRVGGAVMGGLPNLPFIGADNTEFYSISGQSNMAQYSNSYFADATIILFDAAFTQQTQTFCKTLKQKHCRIFIYDISKKVIGNLSLEIATKIIFQNIETVHLMGNINRNYIEKAGFIVSKIIDWVKE